MKTISEVKKEFEEKFVVKTGTKKIKRVGYWSTPDSEFASAYYADNVWDFIQSTLTEFIEALDLVEKDVLKRFQCPRHDDNLCGGCDACNTHQKLSKCIREKRAVGEKFMEGNND